MLQKKEKLLLNSIDILKDDVNSNHEQLAKIMSQLQESQPETVIGLWNYLLENNWENVVNDTDRYFSIADFLTSQIMQEITNDDGFIQFERYFVSDQKILQAVYQHSPQLPPWTTSVIGTQIRKKNFETANLMLEFLFMNKKNNFHKTNDMCNYCYSEIFKDCIENYIITTRTHYGAGFWQKGIKVDEDIFNFLAYWIDKIDDSQEKARTNVFLAELI